MKKRNPIKIKKELSKEKFKGFDVLPDPDHFPFENIDQLPVSNFNNGKDIMLEDFVEGMVGQVGSVKKGVHIVIGNPRNPKHYFSSSKEEMIDTLIDHLKRVKVYEIPHYLDKPIENIDQLPYSGNLVTEQKNCVTCNSPREKSSESSVNCQNCYNKIWHNGKESYSKLIK